MDCLNLRRLPAAAEILGVHIKTARRRTGPIWDVPARLHRLRDLHAPDGTLLAAGRGRRSRGRLYAGAICRQKARSEKGGPDAAPGRRECDVRDAEGGDERPCRRACRREDHRYQSDPWRATVRILLAIDGSPSSIEARDLVASLSVPGGSSVTMLTAYDVPVAWFGEPLAAGGARLAEAAEALRSEADATLVRLAAPFSSRDWSVDPRVVRGRASGVIVEAAADLAADLIVLGSGAMVRSRRCCSAGVCRGRGAGRLLGPCCQGVAHFSPAGGNRRIAVC